MPMFKCLTALCAAVLLFAGCASPVTFSEALQMKVALTVMATSDLSGKSLIDVGCGAGFPGVPLAIASGAEVTLLDSLGKRMKWLESCLPTLGIHAECVTARAEA